jgi:hypothetical protein
VDVGWERANYSSNLIAIDAPDGGLPDHQHDGPLLSDIQWSRDDGRHGMVRGGKRLAAANTAQGSGAAFRG